MSLGQAAARKASVPNRLKVPDLAVKEIGAFYTGERRAHVRKRLRALRLVLLGKRPAEAARIVNVSAKSVRRWIKSARHGGVAALVHDRPRRRRTASIAEFGKGRVESLRPPPKISSGQLRALATDEKRRRIAKRMRVVADLMDGQSAFKVAVRERMTETTAQRWLADFRARGVDALHHDKGRPPKLGVKQMGVLRALIATFPDISSQQLHAFLIDRFNVRYSDWGLRHLVNRLGFRRVGKLLLPL